MSISSSGSPFINSIQRNVVLEPVDSAHILTALVFLQNVFKEILSEYSLATDPLEASRENAFFSSLTDSLRFGIFTYELENLKEQGLFLPIVKERREEILHQKEYWQSFIEELKNGKDSHFYFEVENMLETGIVIPCNEGYSGTYLIADRNGTAHYVIKPVEEDIFCLNNRKKMATIFNDHSHRARKDIPLYTSVQRSVLAYEIAVLAGIENITPKTMMGIFSHEQFYDFSSRINEENKKSFFASTGNPDCEKLCSIQEFLPNCRNLDEVLRDLYTKGLSDEDIRASFNSSEFEEACLFLWLIFDNDAHAGNFICCVAEQSDEEKKTYSIKKIDNSMCFPENNSCYFNTLAWMPNAMAHLSESLKQKIANLPCETILKRMDDYGLSSCKEAFLERVRILKTLSLRESISLAEIDLRLFLLSKIQNKDNESSDMLFQEILNKIYGTSLL